jgi:hypothetical protein
MLERAFQVGAARRSLSQHGISALRSAQPVASNATIDGRQQNRRVEVVVNDRGSAPATGAGSTGPVTSIPTGGTLVR